jgi:transposase
VDDKILKTLTDCRSFFLNPQNTRHRHYEALRAYFVEKKPSKQVAQQFGFTPGSFRVLCHQFRRESEPEFFQEAKRGPRSQPKKDAAREQIIAMRKRNFSVYEVSDALKQLRIPLGPTAVREVLRDEGFSPLPRRRDDERPDGLRPEKAHVADAQKIDLGPRHFRTRFGGLFLFLPALIQIGFDKIVKQVGLPGTKMIPASHATRTLLGLKLFGNARKSHVMSYVFDEGLALFAGLNVPPKRSFLTEYSCRIDPSCYPKLMRMWFEAATKLGLGRGTSFDLDFHTIPFHGEDALMEKHYVSRRSRRQKGVLAFLAQDEGKHVFCYANSELRKDEQKDEILRFVQFWQQRTKRLPQELVFDSQLTTYENLNRLNQMNIDFITLRRRSSKMLQQIHTQPLSAWRRIELERVSRAYRTPRILDQKITLKGYDGSIRELVITDLGHEEPTFLLTNQMRRSPSKLIERYAHRMLIENSIADGIDFFHMDALSSAVAMKVNCDLQLTLMASSLYRLLGDRIGNGYETAKSRHIFRDFVEATATVFVDERNITVRYQKRAHNPLLIASGFADTDIRVPWLGGKRLNLVFG